MNEGMKDSHQLRHHDVSPLLSSVLNSPHCLLSALLNFQLLCDSFRVLDRMWQDPISLFTSLVRDLAEGKICSLPITVYILFPTEFIR